MAQIKEGKGKRGGEICMFRGDFLRRESHLGYDRWHLLYFEQAEAHRHFPQGFSDTTSVYCVI